MPDATLTHLVMLLDRSGSMQSIKAATQEGFDAFLTEQRGTPGRCRVTLAQFDHEYQEVYVDRDVADVPPLDLQPRGRTALLDSIGRVVHTTAERLARLPEAERPANVIVGIMTDGHENASREYTHAAVKALVTEREEIDGWTFLYLGANQDAIEVGASVGIPRGRSMTYTTGNVAAAYAATSRAMSDVRTAVAAGAAPAAARDQHAVYSDAERAAAAGPDVPAPGTTASAGVPRAGARRTGVATAAPGDGSQRHPFTEAELLTHLRGWLSTGEKTVADVATYGGRAALHALVAGHAVYVNADTRRDAVQELVDTAARGPVTWQVIANRVGRLDKVTFRPGGERVPGFYCYTVAAQPVAGPLGGVPSVR
jgi:hypothetical protein